MDYDKMLWILHNARVDLARAKEAKSKAYTDFITSIGYVDLIQDVETFEAIVQELEEEEIRLEAQLGAKNNPHPAVTVKTFTEYQFEEAEAIDYCKINAPVALNVSLNQLVFKRILDTGRQLPFVEVLKVRKAQIRADLSKFFGGEK